MVDTIMPLVLEAKARSVRALFGHTLASVAAGAAVGAWLGLLGAALLGPMADEALAAVLLVAGIAAAAYALSEFGIWTIPIAERANQVPEDWRRTLGPERGLILYGLMLGAGFFTYLVSPVMYFVFLLEFLSLSPFAGAIIGATYGIARTIPIFVSGVPLALGMDQTKELQLRWLLAGLPFRTLTGAALALVAVTAGGVVFL